MPDGDKVLSVEEQSKLRKQLDQALKLTLKKRDWIVIYNILVRQQYGLGDARIVSVIVDQIQPLVVTDTNVPDPNDPNPGEEGVIVS